MNMKKHTFFLISLFLALAALGLQVFGFVQSSKPNNNVIATTLILCGLAFAIFSLISVVVSLLRRESGRSFISLIVLIIYLGTWGILLV
jgi:hypothetical protein